MTLAALLACQNTVVERHCEIHIIATMQPWHLRKSRLIVYAALPLCFMGIIAASAMDAGSASEALVAMRQLFGLWALASCSRRCWSAR